MTEAAAIAQAINQSIARDTRGDLWLWGRCTGKPGDGDFVFAGAVVNGGFLHLQETTHRIERARFVPDRESGLLVLEPQGFSLKYNGFLIESSAHFTWGNFSWKFDGHHVFLFEGNRSTGFFSPEGPAIQFLA